MKYNINELLEKKKELEEQIAYKISEIKPDDLQYTERTVTDIQSGKDSKFAPKEKQTLREFTQQLYGYIEELEKVKTAIQQYNAEKILGEIQKRETARLKLTALKTIKNRIPANRDRTRKVTRQDKDGVALETTEVNIEPMFKIEDVEKEINTYAAQERKINTHIQKVNLDAEIEL